MNQEQEKQTFFCFDCARALEIAHAKTVEVYVDPGVGWQAYACSDCNEMRRAEGIAKLELEGKLTTRCYTLYSIEEYLTVRMEEDEDKRKGVYDAQ
jgi:hypothetical protein